MVADVHKVQGKANNWDVRQNNELPYVLQESLPVCLVGSFFSVCHPERLIY